MAVDAALIESLSSYEDPELAILERFLTPTIGGGRTVALLTTPRATTPTTGWVICHSFGPEQDYLQSFEAGLARRLASEGFAALRFHAQGYGDSELGMDRIDPDTHVACSVEAGRLLARELAIADIGFIGARFGGTIAALAASSSGASKLAVLDTVVHGNAYLKSMIRGHMMANLPTDGSASGRQDPIDALRQGVLDLDGLEVAPHVVDQLVSLDLLAALRSFAGDALVVQISRSADLKRETRALVDRLTELGADCSTEVVVDPNALKFGLPRYRATGESTKVDVMADINEAATEAVVSWAVASATGPSGSDR